MATAKDESTAQGGGGKEVRWQRQQREPEHGVNKFGVLFWRACDRHNGVVSKVPPPGTAASSPDTTQQAHLHERTNATERDTLPVPVQYWPPGLLLPRRGVHGDDGDLTPTRIRPDAERVGRVGFSLFELVG